MTRVANYRVEIHHEHPVNHGDGLAPDVVHVVQDETTGKRKWVYFKCPCGCGNVAMLSLMVKSQPHWALTIQNDLPTLNPSVNARGFPCGSHFWITKGEVKWV